MISKKKYIITIIAVVIVTTFLAMTVGNVLLVEVGEKVVITRDHYTELSNMAKKYAKQESVMEYAKKNFLDTI